MIGPSLTMRFLGLVVMLVFVGVPIVTVVVFVLVSVAVCAMVMLVFAGMAIVAMVMLVLVGVAVITMMVFVFVLMAVTTVHLRRLVVFGSDVGRREGDHRRGDNECGKVQPAGCGAFHFY